MTKLTALVEPRGSGALTRVKGNPNRANEDMQWIVPRTATFDGTSRLVLYCHGAGAYPNYELDGQPMFSKLAGSGFTVLSTQRDQGPLGASTWGCDQVRTWLVGDVIYGLYPARPPSGLHVWSGSIAIMAFSMGALEAWGLAARLAAVNVKVAGVITIEGAQSLAFERGTDALSGHWAGTYSVASLVGDVLTATTPAFSPSMVGASGVLDFAGTGVFYPITTFLSTTQVALTPTPPSIANGFYTTPLDLSGNILAVASLNAAFVNDPVNPHLGSTPVDSDFTTALYPVYDPMQFVIGDPVLRQVPQLLFANTEDVVVGHSVQCGQIHHQWAAAKGYIDLVEFPGNGNHGTINANLPSSIDTILAWLDNLDW